MKTLMTLLLALAAGSALASNPGEGGRGETDYVAEGAFVYAMFEAAVPHVDLEFCPREFDPEAVFCRMTLAEGQAHVFVFAEAGEQRLLAIRHYDMGNGLLRF